MMYYNMANQLRHRRKERVFHHPEFDPIRTQLPRPLFLRPITEELLRGDEVLS